jgi:hypothetical protein
MPRPKFQPTEEQRHRVKALARCHVRPEQIACILSLKSVAMLRKHFREELAMGAAEAKTKVLTRLFDMATSGRHPSATMFWLKTRARWSEKGNRPESITPKEDHRWLIEEYQPPTPPEHQSAFDEAVRRLQGASGQAPPEWEGDTGAPQEDAW